MSYTKIIDNLYLGSYRDVLNKTYEKENIDVIINVAEECKKKDMTAEYFYFPCQDIPTNLISTLFDEISDLIHSYRMQNKKVFIHCVAGKSRSVSFVIIYLMKYLNYSLNTAYEYVDNLREIYPNLGFVNQMMQYELNTTNQSTLDYDKVVIQNIFDTTGFISKEEVKEIYEQSNKDIDITLKTIFRENI